MRVAAAVDLNSEQRAELQRLVRRRTTPVRVVERCRIVLLAGEGMQDLQIARQLEVAPRMAARWRARILQLGVAGLLQDAPRPGRKPTISAETVVQSGEQDHTERTGERHAVVAQHYGAGGGHFRFQRGPHLARSRTEAASGPSPLPGPFRQHRPSGNSPEYGDPNAHQ